MSCCGRSRSPAPRPPVPIAAPRPVPAASPTTPPPRTGIVSFVYEGPTRLLAEGPITRRTYRFEHRGAVVGVDSRDAPSLAAIPHLRRASAPPG